MSKDIYGMTTVHPENVVQPGWTEKLPDKVEGTVRFFDTVVGVTQAVNDCSQGNWYFNTQFGPAQDQRLTIGSIGVVYRVAVSDELMQYAQEHKQKTANAAYLFTSQLPVDSIQDVVAILPEDILHPSQIVELADAPKILNKRREHMMMLDEMLKMSKQHHRTNFNANDERQLTSIRMTYGSSGFLTNPAAHQEIAQFVTIMKEILESGKAHLDYVMAMPHLSHLYKTEVMKTEVSDKRHLHLLAAKDLLANVASIADKNGDFKMRSLLYSMQNSISKELAAYQPATPPAAPVQPAAATFDF